MTQSLKALASVGLFLALVLSACAADAPAPTPPPAQPPNTARELAGYRDFALVHDGNAARGRELFNDPQRAACVRCHSVDGTSSKAGPDLFAVGDKFPRSELIHAVLEPSAEIAVGYSATIVETKSGEEITGIIKEATPQMLDLVGGDGLHVRIATGDIKTQRTSPVSLMPQGLQAGLTRQEFTDLMDYLITLRQPENSLTSNRGMPPEIPELAKPVAVQPFFAEDLRFPHGEDQKSGQARFGSTWFCQMPGMSNTFLAVQQPGNIWLVEKSAGHDVKTLFLDATNEVFSWRGPNGLLSMAFHPRFLENHKYYLKHQVSENGKMATVVTERTASADFRTDSGQPSRRIWQVSGSADDHSGGCIAFGPDGFLYIGMGDTGPQQDPQGHGQDLMLHLGKILRIDVDHADPGLAYAIPTDNPFRGRSDARPEIWAYGFREPWRFSFDRVTGDLWVGNVGQNRVEEISIVRRGENMGWNVYEAFEPFSNRYRKEGITYVPPVFAYRRKFGNCVVGGYVYRGDPRSSFYGVYICGDFTSRRIFGLKQQNRTLQVVRQIGTAPENIASFGEDREGNLYVVGFKGMTFKLNFADAVFEGASIASVAPAPATTH